MKNNVVKIVACALAAAAILAGSILCTVTVEADNTVLCIFDFVKVLC